VVSDCLSNGDRELCVPRLDIYKDAMKALEASEWERDARDTPELLEALWVGRKQLSHVHRLA
jgi:hypothetical protein